MEKYRRKSVTPPQKARYRALTEALKQYPGLKCFSEKTAEEIYYIENGMMALPGRFSRMIEKESREAACRAYALEKSRRKTAVDAHLAKLEEAIMAISHERGAEMISLKYLSPEKKLTDEDIMEILNVSRSTYYRYRNALFSKMSLIYFGED